MRNLKKTDNRIYKLIKEEEKRQKSGVVLIPSENYPSDSVLECLSTVLNNKYSEGYPGKRYYSGNKFVDDIENEAIERAKKLFGVDHVNVQPHSGAIANYAALSAVLEPGDKILSMDLNHGGHLTHGSPANFSGKLYDLSFYGVSKEDGKIDYIELERMVSENKPKLVISGASSYPRDIDFEKISDICRRFGVIHLADISHVAGLIATGLHTSSVSADIITSTTHKTLRGPRGAIIMCKYEYAKKIDKAVFPGLQGGPLENVIAAKAVCFKEALAPSFIDYQKQVLKNAKVLERVFLENNFDLVSGGTDNHMLLIDLRKFNLDGDQVSKALENVEIYVNKNLIPWDTGTSVRPSGIRLGTPFITTMGYKEKEVELVGNRIVEVTKGLSKR